MARAADKPTVELHHPMFDEYPPSRVWSWGEAPHGVLLARLDDTTGLVWATGEAGEGSVDVFEEGLRSLLSRPGTQLFWDLETLDRYAPKVRRMIVELLAAERKKLERIHLLSDKAMIAMAASAVNLVLGGILQVHRERAPWAKALRKQLGESLQGSTASGVQPSASSASASTSTATSSSAAASASRSTLSSWRRRDEAEEPGTDSGSRWRKR